MATVKNTLPVKPAASPAAAAAVSAAQKRIDTALASKPTGPKGFLIWVKAAFPGPIADKILAAAKAHQAATAKAAASGPIASMSNAAKTGVGGFARLGRYEGRTTYGNIRAIGPFPTRGSRALTFTGRQRRMGMGALGDATTDALGSDALSSFTVDTSSPASDPTIANASTSSASPSWLSSIGTAVSAATQAYLGIQQSKDAQTLFNTNLQRAQQGLQPLNANPSAYGITAPQVNVGLSSSTTTLLMYGGIGLGVILLLNVGLKASKKG